MSQLGNLDSKNSLEIMNIIKAISKTKTVILVTHEQNLAKFYASRIIEIKDGVIQKDYKNETNSELDYALENTIYLKDLKEKEVVDTPNLSIKYYSENKEKLNLKLVVKNGNIYIQPENNRRVEVIDEHSNIELVDKSYQKIDKSVYQEYEFQFDKAINKNIKKKYASIINPFTLIIQGFKKVSDFPIIKKILLAGFFVSSMFIVYSFCSTAGTLNIQDKDFVTVNRNYLTISMNNIDVDKYLEYEKLEEVNYILPGNSNVTFTVKYKDLYQTSFNDDELTASLSSLKMINEDKLIYGKMPQNEYEVVVDKMAIEKTFKTNTAKMSGVLSVEDMLGRTINLKNLNEFKIVGIVDLQSPSIYTNEDMFINILSNKGTSRGNEGNMFFGAISASNEENENDTKLTDYTLLKDKIELKKGHFPEADYEVAVNIDLKEQMPLNKTIDVKVNDKKLKVVGYYFSKESRNDYLVNNNTIKYNLIKNSSNITVYSKERETALKKFKEENINIQDSYEKSRQEYIKDKKESITSSLVFGGIIFGISLIEIYLMVRSSFLSRIKEVGIYRAIGVKKSDIYKMFLGEILAITSIASIPGALFMAYIIKILTGIQYISNYFKINTPIILGAIIFIYAFNSLIGLLPVFNTLRKTPAQILSRHDI